jgi:hypothetical protein
VEAATDAYLNFTPAAPADIFDFTYAQLPADLAWQKAGSLPGDADA